MGREIQEEGMINELNIHHKLNQILFENITEAVIFTENSNIIDCNKSALQLFGLKIKNELKGKSIFELSPDFQEDGIRSSVKFIQLIKAIQKPAQNLIDWNFFTTSNRLLNCVLQIHGYTENDQIYLILTIKKEQKKEFKIENEQESGILEHEEYLHKIIEIFPQPVFVKNQDLVYIYCNEAFAKYIGLPKDKIIGSTVFDISDKEYAEIYHKADLELLQNKKTQVYESKVKYHNESKHDVVFHKNILLNNDGTKNGIIGFIDDVSEIKKKKNEVLESENRYKKIFSNIQDVFYQTDLNGIITEISPSFAKYSAYTLDEVIGSPIIDFYYFQEDREILLKKLAEKGEILDYELLIRGKNDIKIWCSTNAHFWFDKNGNVGGVEGVLRDITERKRDENKLKLSLSLLKATLDSTSEGILVVDQVGNIKSYNNQFKSLFAIPEEILATENDSLLLEFVLNKFKDPSIFLSKIQYLYNNLEEESFDELELKDGRIFERYSCPQILDDKPVGRVWSHKDVTSRKKTESENKLMAQAIRSTNECITITDTENNILFTNAAFLNTYGYLESDLIGKNISIVRSPNNDPKIINDLDEFGGKIGWQGEILNLKSDGTEFPISLSTSVVKDEKDEVIGLVGVAMDISERRQAENELRESEERYRGFFEGSADAIILANVKTGIIVDANPASEILLKKPLSEIIGMNHTKLHPAEKEEYTKNIFQAKGEKQNEVRKPTENRIVRSDGQEIPVEIAANIIHLNGEKVLQGVFRDISDRKIAEKALQESEIKYRQLVEFQGEGVTIVDINENFVFANPAAETIFGVGPKGLLNRNLNEFISSDQFEKVQIESRKRLNNEKSTYEIEIKTPGGELKNILVTATPQIDYEGKYNGTFGVFRDITDRRIAEESLRKSEAKYRNLIEIMPDGVYRSSPDGKFIDVNPAMVNILGYSNKEELMAIDIKNDLYFDLADRESEALLTHKEELDVFPVRKKDGSTVYLEDHGWYVTDDKDNIIYHEGISRDVTDRRNAEIQLQKYSLELKEANATKDKFYSIIAHDLKSPFNSITGLSEIIKNESKHLDVATIEQYAAVIFSTSKNTYQLLENLLEWAQVMQSRLPFRPDSLILNKLVNEVIDLMYEKASTKKILVENQIPDNMIITADENMLKTIFRNLISNALKFTSTNGMVSISAIIKEEMFEFMVKDTGIGIRAEDVKKIFKIGSNFSKRGTENEKGTGLGLLLCKEFVEKHEGTIWIESEPGKGSEFKFTIPIESKMKTTN